jgi:hypothetical protein
LKYYELELLRSIAWAANEFETYFALGLVPAMEIPQKKVHRLVSPFPERAGGP